MEKNLAESLRDQLSEQVTALEETAQTPPEVTTGEAITNEPAGSEAAASTSSADLQKPGRTAGRARDEHGKLLPGKAQRPETPAAPAQVENQPKPSAGPSGAATAEPKPLKRPSTWKKETWGIWDKVEKGEALTPQEARQFAEEAARRDGDYTAGVSTYKGEFEKAQPLLKAIEPFKATLDRHGINPTEHVQRLFSAHERLALGNPQEKLAMFAQLAQQYQVPLQGLFVQGQDGQIQFNQTLLQQAAQPRPQQDPRQIVKAILEEEKAAQSIAQMEKDEEKYPHFQVVRQDMGRLLDAGLAQDLDSAYKQALRLEQHLHLYEADQQLIRQQDEARRKAEAQAQAQRARANAVSPKSQTPTGQATSGGKGLRSTLVEQFDAHAGGGRV